MGAPKGNKFWQLRSKHGRDKLFSSPELLWETACEYFQWCEDNPLMETDYKGKDAEMVLIPKMRPFTLFGLCRYLDCSSSYFRAFKATSKKGDEDFLTVITRIEETIYDQKFTGAASGFLNPNIISRDLGLSDKQEVDHSTKGESLNKGKLDISKLTKDERVAVLNAIRESKNAVD